MINKTCILREIYYEKFLQAVLGSANMTTTKRLEVLTQVEGSMNGSKEGGREVEHTHTPSERKVSGSTQSVQWKET